jgi:trimethylamine corrinoid protein
MDESEILNQMAEAVVGLNRLEATKLANLAITQKMDLVKVIEKGFGEGIRKVGDLWDEGEFFLPELMSGAQIMQEAVDILTPAFQSSGSDRQSTGKVVLATIEGDIHSIGKTIVATMLRANGFEVLDLGTDVKAEKIVEEAKKFNANIIGVSALLTTTMIHQKKVIEILEGENLRSNFKVMFGGAPVTQKWVDECNADGYAENAVEAVKLAKSLVKHA